MNEDAPCLFIGRWQPWHAGHQALLEVKLHEGKDVIIAVRDTKKSEKNPYSYRQRYNMIQKAMSEWGDRVRIIKIPDISSVVYGRDVGYKIEQISLHPELEAISGTQLRNEALHVKNLRKNKQ